MQSTNEELEASKEELQSLNEELHTVNSELNDKVEALDRANVDLQNLFANTQIATVFLDRQLVIRSFTPSLKEIFNVLPSDRGRPITDLTGRLSLTDLAEDVRRVIAAGKEQERHLADADDKAHFLVRLAPYRDADQRPKGVVVTFADVTSAREAETTGRRLIDELNHRVKNMLTVVIGMLEQTLKTAEPANFRDVFLGRLHAMSRSYELLSHERWGAVSVGELIGQELRPFGMERVACVGPELRVPPRQPLALGMVLHELATNAAKYGALSQATGTIRVEWGQDGDEVQLGWTERGGPAVAPPTRRGLGLKLIERETAGGLGGTAATRFDNDGLSVTIVFKIK